MHRRHLLCAAAFAAAAILFAGAAAAQERLTIGTEGAYPPFNNLTAAGELVGFDIDIAKALCAHMTVECDFVAVDWDGLIPALQAGKIDVIAASLTITDERKKQVAFTRQILRHAAGDRRAKGGWHRIDRRDGAGRQDARRAGLDHGRRISRPGPLARPARC